MSTQIVLPRALADEMIAHCLAGRPNEACGILAFDGDHVVKVFAMRNAAARPVRYALDDREQIVVREQLDAQGWELGGVFHSHTRTEAYPSPTDVREAFEDVAYLIVSLGGQTPVVRAFRIVKEDRIDPHGDIQELEVRVVHGGADGAEEPATLGG
jgi:[CysO sulfur-carrier protein]-S-L-cysteine hydrolase